jgi:hypothetical protein
MSAGTREYGSAAGVEKLIIFENPDGCRDGIEARAGFLQDRVSSIERSPQPSPKIVFDRGRDLIR